MIYQTNIDNRKVLPDFDQTLIWSVILLLSLGLVMVYSASIATELGGGTNDHTTYFLVRHSIYLVIGLLVGFIAFQIPIRLWQKCSPYLFLFGVILLVLVLIPGIGREINGSKRWLSLLVINLQPSELMKLFVVIYAADYTVRKAAYLNSFRKGFFPMLIVILLVGALLLKEPDLGAFVIIISIVMAVLFLGGISLKLFLGLIGLLFISLLALIVFEPYRYDRMVGFMNPWTDPYGKGYQLSHSLMAFGRGEWFGVGLGGSVEKLLYLPEAHTDFLLAVIAEELGFLGVIIVIMLFGWLVTRAFLIGRQAFIQKHCFGALVAQGIGVWFGVQAFINMGVNMGILPTKGITLPLMSFGGSSIVTNCLALAILLRVDWDSRQLQKGYTT